jgi:hypothetical protein
MESLRIIRIALSIVLLIPLSPFLGRLITRAGGQAVSAKSEISLPFELISNHVFLRGSVAGSGPLWFVLDTGDKFGVIDLTKAKALGLQLQGQIGVGGAGEGMLKASFVKDASMTLLGLEGAPQKLSLAMPLQDLAQILGHDFDGILGQDFISQFVIEIDYINKRLVLHDKDKYTYSGAGEAVPITLNMAGHPQVTAQLLDNGRDPVEGTFALDIGYGGSLVVNKSFVEKNQLLPPTRKTIPAIAGIGAGGESKALIGRVSAFKLGRFIVQNPVVSFSQDTRGAAAFLNVVGAEILKKFKVILDYGRNRVILEPNSGFTDLIEYHKSGLFLRANGIGDHPQFTVMSTIENSPASEAGIQKGDMLVAINGKPAAEFTLPQINEMLKQETLFVLRFKRGEGFVDVKLKPRRLV